MRLLLVFLPLVLISGAFALGISPGIVNYDFSSGGTYHGKACVTDGVGKNISLSVSDDYLITEIEFDRNKFIAENYEECVNYTFKTAFFIEPERSGSIYIYAEEAPSEEGMAFGVRVGQQIAIDTTGAPLKEDVPEMGLTFASVGVGVFIVAVLALLFIRRKRN